LANPEKPGFTVGSQGSVVPGIVIWADEEVAVGVAAGVGVGADVGIGVGAMLAEKAASDSRDPLWPVANGEPGTAVKVPSLPITNTAIVLSSLAT